MATTNVIDERQSPASLRLYLRGIRRTPLLTAAEEVALAKRIEAGVYAAHLLDTDTELTVRQRDELADVVHDGQDAQNHMVRANLRLVVAIAKRYVATESELLDVIQDGNVGLIHAVEKFDYAKGCKFSTYATWWIRQSIERVRNVSSHCIHIPAHAAEELAAWDRVENMLRQHLDHEPTIGELAVEAGVPAARIVHLRSVARDPMTLDELMGRHAAVSLADRLADDGPSPDELAEVGERARDVGAAVGSLPAKIATVIRLRYGLSDGRPHTRPEAARRLHLTRYQVEQLERAGLEQLRGPMLRDRLLAWAG